MDIYKKPLKVQERVQLQRLSPAVHAKHYIALQKSSDKFHQGSCIPYYVTSLVHIPDICHWMGVSKC